MLLSSFRFALRLFAKSPSFTFIAVFVLALGIGSVTTMFSVINGALIRGLPFPEQEELMFVQRLDSERNQWNREIPAHDLLDLKRDQSSFTALAGWFGGTINVTYDDNPVRLEGSRISATWLDILGAQPFMGRTFTTEEDTRGAPPVAILNYRTWKGYFGGKTDIIGQSVRINGSVGTVIGVMPKDFDFPNNDDLWIPLNSSMVWDDRGRSNWNVNVMGRLKDGITREQAEAEMTRFMVALAEEFPDTHGDFRVAAVNPIAGELLGDQTIRMLWIMFAMGVFVLLIACANVANLLLARSTLRSKELAIRNSLGANRRSLISQLLVESVTLSMCGAMIGLLMSVWATKVLTHYAQLMNTPPWMYFDIDWRVLLVVTLVTLLAGVLAGLVPAIRASKVSVSEILKDDTRTGSSVKLSLFAKGMVVVQVAVSSLLLILTVLMMRSVQEINSTEMNFDTEGVFTARMGLFQGDYPEPDQRYQFFSELIRNVEQKPEIASVAMYGRYRWTLTGVNWGRVSSDHLQDTEFDALPLATNEVVSPRYFETLGVDLIEGREFNEFDTAEGEQVVILNQALAEILFPNGDAIGKRIYREWWPPERANMSEEELEEGPTWRTIVGIAPNMAAQGVGNTTGAEGRHYWVPLSPENAQPFMTIAVSPTGSNPLAVNKAVRSAVQTLDPNLPLYAVGTPAQLIEEDTIGNQIISNIFKFFGALAMFLASVGIYGVMSFSVNQRTLEFGIRAALGATRNRILGMVMRSGLLQFIIGLMVGLILAFLGSRLVQSFLYGISAQDPTTFIVVAVTFTLVAIFACFVPARRAASIHPAQALRHE